MFAMTFIITQHDHRAQLELAGCLRVPSRNLSSPSVFYFLFFLFAITQGKPMLTYNTNSINIILL